MNLLDCRSLLDFHDRFIREPRMLDDGALWRWIGENHQRNCALWKEEDRARRTDVPDAEIVRCKRAIDRHNQARNDAVERIDQVLLQNLPAREDTPLSSETAGAMIDRLSILALKIHHMRLQTERTDVDEAHRRACREKLERLLEQRADLAGCLDALLGDAQSGKVRFKVYRQFKMYNDPKLNPELYAPRAPSRSTPAAAAWPADCAPGRSGSPAG